MSTTELFLLLVRWAHLVAAAAWVGGSLFYLLVLRPAIRRSPDSSKVVGFAAASEFRALADTSIFVLIATGIIMTFNRLTPGIGGASYVVILGVKVALALWMFVLVWGRRSRYPTPSSCPDPSIFDSNRLRKMGRALSGYNAVVILGMVVFLLSDLLKMLFEVALSRG